MAGEYTPQQLAMLEAQVAHVVSADRVRDEAALWRDSTPEERFAALAEMFEATDRFLEQLPPEQVERITRREPLPDDSIAVLTALRKLPR